MKARTAIMAALLANASIGVIVILGLLRRLKSGVSPDPQELWVILRLHLFAMGVVTALSLMVFLLLGRVLRAMDRNIHKKSRNIGTLENRMAADRDAAELLVRINDLTEVFGETHDLKAVLTEAVKVLQDVLNVKILVLQLYSHEDSRFFHRIERPEGADIDLGDEVKEDVIIRGRSRLINALDTMPAYAGLSEKGYRSLIVAPVTRIAMGGAKESTGMIAALTTERRDFTSHDLSLLSSFAKQAGLIIENAHLYEKTEHMAMHDGLTNLVNQRRFKELLDVQVEKARKSGNSFCIMLGDIDFFKNYNDTHGHEQGNEVLRGVADILLSNTRGADIVARYGGEEFVVILPNTSLEGARIVGENLVSRVREVPFSGQEKQPNGNLTITFGLASYPDDGADAGSLIEAADQAMYKGKEGGKDRLIVARDPAASGS